MNGAGAAQRHAATELRAGQAQHVAQNPEQRRVAVRVNGVLLPVDAYRGRHARLPRFVIPRLGSDEQSSALEGAVNVTKAAFLQIVQTGGGNRGGRIHPTILRTESLATSRGNKA